MKTKIKLFALMLIMSLHVFQAMSQPQGEEKAKTKFSLEIDPATFIFKGYSAHLRIQPKNSKHMLYGIGVYAMDFPDVFVDLNTNNRDKGWNVRLNQGVGLFTEYHFREVNKGFFAGGQLAWQQYKIENDNLQGSEKFNTALIMGYGGYTIQPFQFPLYFKLWGGLGYNTKVSGENTLEGFVYDISPLSVFATLHLGYTF